jgi:hypothetical protein
MPSLTVYQIPQVTQITRAGATGVNSATTRIDFDLSKNVTNEIEFLLKDIDRRPISLANKSIVMYVVDSDSQTLKLQKNLQVINDARGHCRLTISPSDIGEWAEAYYSYSLVLERTDGSQILIYCDQNRSSYGFLEVKAGPLPPPNNIYEIGDDQFAHQTYGVTNQPVSGIPYRVSGGTPGAAQRDNRAGQHTVAIYSQNFKGLFKVQASLDNSLPTDDMGWFDVEGANITLDQVSGITAMTFQGSLMWVRFIYIPDPTNTGTVSKVLFKN